MNLSAIPVDSAIGRLLRLPLRLLPDSLRMPILQGPARGMRWIVGSSNHGCWLGSHEIEKRRMLERFLEPGMVFYDIGANVGFYSLIGSRLVGPSGRVLAFEPFAENLEYLQRHLETNGVENVTVFERALARRPGPTRYQPGADGRRIEVSTVGTRFADSSTLDSLVLDWKLPHPGVMKIDVKGAEIAVLEGARRTIAESRPVVLVATHDEGLTRRSTRALEDLGYRVSSFGTSKPELLATP